MNSEWILREIYNDTRRRAPQLSPCQLARKLNLSEGALQAARQGDGVEGLALTACDLVMQLAALGALRVTTHATHASMTSARVLFDAQGQHQAIAGARMQWLLPCWYWACLVSTNDAPLPAWPHLRLDIFDRYGVCLHSLAPHGDDQTSEAGWQRLNLFRHDVSPQFIQRIVTRTEAAPLKADWQRDWQQLGTPESLGSLLRQHGCTRLHAYRAAEGTFTQRLSPQTFVKTLAQSDTTRYALQLALHRPSALHTQRGYYRAPVLSGDRWHTRCRDTAFDIDTQAVAETWWALFPGQDQSQLCIDAFDHQGALLARLTEVA